MVQPLRTAVRQSARQRLQTILNSDLEFLVRLDVNVGRTLFSLMLSELLPEDRCCFLVFVRSSEVYFSTYRRILRGWIRW